MRILWDWSRCIVMILVRDRTVEIAVDGYFSVAVPDRHGTKCWRHLSEKSLPYRDENVLSTVIRQARICPRDGY